MPGPGPVGAPAVAWTFEAGAPIGSSPLVVDDAVVVVDRDGTIHSVALETGLEQWAVELGAETAGTPVADASRVVVGDDAGRLTALRLTDGTSVWTADLDGAISGSPAWVGERIIAASGSGTAYGVDAATGAVAWSTPLGAGITKSIAMTADIAYLGVSGGDLVALDVDNGAIRWRAAVAESGEIGTPAVVGSLVYAATGIDADDPTAKAMTAIDVATGAIRWRYASPEQVQVYTAAVVDGRAFIVGEDGRVVAVDAQTGATAWSVEGGIPDRGVAVGGRRDRLRRRRRWSGDRARRGDGEHPLDRPGRGHPVRANGRAGIPVGRYKYRHPVRDRRAGSMTTATHQPQPIERHHTRRTGTRSVPVERRITMVDGGIHGVMRLVAGLALVSIVLACGAPANPPTAASAPASAPASVAQAATPAPTPIPEPSPVDPGVVPATAPLKRLWSATGLPVEGSRVGNPTVDPAGRIWALSGADAFWVFDGDDGHFIETWGKAGNGDGELDFHRDTDIFGSLAFAPDGSFYVAEAGNHRVQHFGADRTFVAKFGSFGTDDDQFVSPNLLKVDTAGNVYVHDDDLGVIKMFRGDGTYVRTFPGLYPFFHVDTNGHLYSADEDKVLREYGPDGQLLRGIALGQLVSFISAIVVDDRGHIWIGSNREEGRLAVPDRLLELDADGRLIHDWTGLPVDGLALDVEGKRLYSTFFEPDILSAYAVPTE